MCWSLRTLCRLNCSVLHKLDIIQSWRWRQSQNWCYSWSLKRCPDLVLRCGGSRKRICDELQREEVLLLVGEFHLGLWATSLPACSSWSSGGRQSWYWRTSCNRNHGQSTILAVSSHSKIQLHILNLFLSISSHCRELGIWIYKYKCLVPSQPRWVQATAVVTAWHDNTKCYPQYPLIIELIIGAICNHHTRPQTCKPCVTLLDKTKGAY